MRGENGDEVGRGESAGLPALGEQPGLGLRVDLGATLWVDLERSTQVLTGV